MDQSLSRLPRRDVLKFIAASALLPHGMMSPVVAQAVTTVKGYGTDPDLIKEHKPGDVWPLVMNDVQRSACKTLADIILPADDLGPAASSLRVHDYIDEWISAPYPSQVEDRPIILNGLAWIDSEAQRLHQKNYGAISSAQQIGICQSIAEPDAKSPDHQKLHPFFLRFRAIAMGAYYGTTAGWKSIGYIGNVPSVNFDGPSPELLAKLGLEQTVK
jgi:hypothetical protein